VTSLILLGAGYEDLQHAPQATSQEIEHYVDFSTLILSEEVPAQNIQILDTHEIQEGIHGGQCVTWIQRYFNSYYTHPDFRGHAKDITPNSIEPRIGSAVITTEGEGHAALIIAIDEDNLILAESNYRGDEKVTKGRILTKDSHLIRGYFNFSN